MPDLSIVVPVHNEAANVDALIEEIYSVLGDLEIELILVDDGSTDETADRLRALADRFPLHCLSHPANLGQSAALCNGILHARSEWIATLDGDGQNDPADILKLRDGLRRIADPRLKLLCGWRQARHDSWIKCQSSRIANGIRSRMLRDGTPDAGCGLKLIERRAFLTLPRFDHMHRFLPALIQMQGGRTVSLPVNHRPRRQGVSKYGIRNRLWAGVIDLLGVMWLKKRWLKIAAPAEPPPWSGRSPQV